MPRPIKCRRVSFFPGVTYFKPAGIPLRDLEEVQLSVEEVEAIRLKDLEGLDQQEGAERMHISRPTFQRILSSAREKIADALLRGKAMKIEGGNFELMPRRYGCSAGHEWDVPYQSVVECPPIDCPVCHSTKIGQLLPPEKECPHPGSGRCCERKSQTL